MNLLGIHELAELLGVSRQRADQLARHAGFPRPAAELRGGRIWKRTEVDKWIRINRSPDSLKHATPERLAEIARSPREDKP